MCENFIRTAFHDRSDLKSWSSAFIYIQFKKKNLKIYHFYRWSMKTYQISYLSLSVMQSCFIYNIIYKHSNYNISSVVKTITV